jgi:hypothetical protein
MPSDNSDLRIIGFGEAGVRHMTRSQWEAPKVGVEVGRMRNERYVFG